MWEMPYVTWINCPQPFTRGSLDRIKKISRAGSVGKATFFVGHSVYATILTFVGCTRWPWYVAQNFILIMTYFIFNKKVKTKEMRATITSFFIINEMWAGPKMECLRWDEIADSCDVWTIVMHHFLQFNNMVSWI